MKSNTPDKSPVRGLAEGVSSNLSYHFAKPCLPCHAQLSRANLTGPSLASPAVPCHTSLCLSRPCPAPPAVPRLTKPRRA